MSVTLSVKYCVSLNCSTHIWLQWISCMRTVGFGWFVAEGLPFNLLVIVKYFEDYHVNIVVMTTMMTNKWSVQPLNYTRSLLKNPSRKSSKQVIMSVHQELTVIFTFSHNVKRKMNAIRKTLAIWKYKIGTLDFWEEKICWKIK